MSNLRQAAQAAEDFLDRRWRKTGACDDDIREHAEALRAALSEPQPEPVAWYYIEDPWGAHEWHWMLDSPESQECDPRDWTPVYAAPQVQQPEPSYMEWANTRHPRW